MLKRVVTSFTYCIFIGNVIFQAPVFHAWFIYVRILLSMIIDLLLVSNDKTVELKPLLANNIISFIVGPGISALCYLRKTAMG